MGERRNNKRKTRAVRVGNSGSEKEERRRRPGLCSQTGANRGEQGRIGGRQGEDRGGQG